MVVDLSISGALLPPPGATSGHQTTHVHETAINYSLPRRTSGTDNLLKTGNGIPTSKRPRSEADDDKDGHLESRDPVCSLLLIML